MTDTPPNAFPHYYICRACAVAKGCLTPDQLQAAGLTGLRGVTMHIGTCEYCEEDRATLCAVTDYHWPKGGPAHVFD